MNNPFKRIQTKHDVSGILKNKILDDISMIKKSFDIADLFLMKFPSTISDCYVHQEIKNGFKK